MIRCSKCGSDITLDMTSESNFCPYCGTPISDNFINDKTIQNSNNQKNIFPDKTNRVESYSQPNSDLKPITPYPTGGLLAWSIITLLLCTIPGIVAIVKTTKINKATTAEEQKAKIASAKDWCLGGTILGIILLAMSIIGNNI